MSSRVPSDVGDPEILLVKSDNRFPSPTRMVVER
jgi:hypothetical protein